jgi:hypothetical protein
MVKIRIPLRPEYNFDPTKQQRAHWRRWGRTLRRSSLFKLLMQIEVAQERPIASREPSWLMRFRDQIREIPRGAAPRGFVGHIEVVQYYLATCPREMIPICMWLLGRCTDRFRLYELKTFCHDPSPQVRKHVAKALRRLEAWPLLKEMVAADPGNLTIRAIATAPAVPVDRRPYDDRLSCFLEKIDRSHAATAAGPSRMPYWSRYTPWQGRPPKSLALIREILWRIRRWVRGA